MGGTLKTIHYRTLRCPIHGKFLTSKPTPGLINSCEGKQVPHLVVDTTTIPGYRRVILGLPAPDQDETGTVSFYIRLTPRLRDYVDTAAETDTELSLGEGRMVSSDQIYEVARVRDSLRTAIFGPSLYGERPMIMGIEYGGRLHTNPPFSSIPPDVLTAVYLWVRSVVRARNGADLWREEIEYA